MTRRLVLVGVELAHVHVLRQLARRPVADVEVVLVAPGDFHYPPMVPGYLQGQYDEAELRIEISALANAAGARLVRAAADRIDGEARVVHANGESIPFDVCSIDVGAEAAGAEVPGVARHAIALRPTSRAVELRARLLALMAGEHPFAVVVVGAGAAGVELALAIRQRVLASPGGGSVALVEKNTTPLARFDHPLQHLATDALLARGVSIALGGRVTAVTASTVALHNGASVPADLVVWSGGSAAPALIRRSGLAHDADGYLLVDRSLRAVDGAPVWGAGGCVALRDFPGLETGADYSVREGPALDRSLRAALGQGRPARYRPQRTSIVLLNTGGGWALMRWKGMHRHSRWAWRLKDMIDRRFVRRYRGSDETARSPS